MKTPYYAAIALGFGLVTVGLWLIYQPAALVAGGVVFAIIGFIGLGMRTSR